MSRIVYINGEFLAEENAKISVFDRGFLFADSVYEVVPVLHGQVIDQAPHIARLRRSLGELSMASPASDAELNELTKELIKRNKLQHGLIYLQITRGAADRDFVYPADAKPSLVMFTQEKNALESASYNHGIRVVTTNDVRWQRRDIKTVQLLPACMAKMEAKARHADDAWLVEDGVITEGSSNNVYIISREGKLITRQLSTAILPGITRQVVLSLLAETELELEERPFSVDEAHAAAEAFMTSASAFVTPVIAINSHRLGDGTPGPITKRVQEIHLRKVMEQARG